MAQQARPAELLSRTSEALREPGTAYISPRAVAGILGISLSDLAAMIGAPRNALSAERAHRKQVQQSLEGIQQILDLAARLSVREDDPTARAAYWFLHQPLYDLGCKTPQELVRAGRSGAVLDYLRDCFYGVYG